MPLVLFQAWAWFKKHWRWVLFPVGILLLILGWTRRTKISVASSSLIEAGEKAQELTEATEKKKEEAVAVRDAEIKKADAELDRAISAVVENQEKKAPELVADDDALNKELLNVGKDQRRVH